MFDGIRLRLIATFLAGVAIALSAPWSLAAEHTVRPAPEISATAWFNSEPLTLADLRGEVVLVEFWTFACWNCQNIEKHVKSWYERYAKEGLRVVAVHTPEFAHERDVENVRKYLKRRKLTRWLSTTISKPGNATRIVTGPPCI